ncbi:hypothetical protein CCACVL1_05286, partial [Corchorus capsularis]
KSYMSPPQAHNSSTPGLLYFRIPRLSFFTTMVEAGDVKA